MSRYTFAAVVPGPISEVRPRVEAALQREGFGVLMEIDVAATLKAKLGEDRAPYLILGACNPVLARRALEIDPSIGALLPCNVVLRETDGRETLVEIVDPEAALGIVAAAEMTPLAGEAAQRLHRVLGGIIEGNGEPEIPTTDPQA